MNTTENQNALAAIDRGLSLIEPQLWVTNRHRALKAEACNMRSGINIAKTSSLLGIVAAGGAGLLLGGTGVGLVGSGIAALGYIATLVSDGLDTGRFAPLPFVRTRIGDRIETLGNAETRELRAQYEAAQMGAGNRSFEADEELYSNLPEELCNEALMISKQGGLVVSMLSQMPTEQRDLAYIQLCTLYNQFGDSLTGLSLQRLQDSVNGRIGGNYAKMRPAEIREYQPPTYELNAPAVEFGELPPANHQIGEATRLGAVDVAAITSEAPGTDPSLETLAALKQYVQQPKNLLVVASGGAGKGITLANVCRMRYEADMTFVAIWCDPKNDPEESGLMKHTGIRAYRFSAASMTGEQIAEKMRGLIQYYRLLVESLPAKSPVWLILDEWWFVMSELKKSDPALLDEIIGMLRGIVSLLDAKHKHIVLVGQSPKLSDILPGCGGLASNMNTIGLFKRDDVGLKILEKAGQCGVVPQSIATRDSLYKVSEQSPRKRAIYFDGQLRPVPELLNFGNYDRDKRQTLNRGEVALRNYADDLPIDLAAPLGEYDPERLVPDDDAVAALNRAYGMSNDAPVSRWDKFRSQSAEYPHIVALADWLERREGKTFTAKQVKDDKKLRELFGEVGSAATSGLSTFKQYGFISQLDDKSYEVLPQLSQG